jgi:hypothetical protein
VLTEYLSGSGNGTAGYDILIQFKGTGWTVDLQTPFKNAADYFTTVSPTISAAAVASARSSSMTCTLPLK